MSRPCHADHPPSPETCRLCFWCADPSEEGRAYRALWGEPESAEPPGRATPDQGVNVNTPTFPESAEPPGLLRRAVAFAGAVARHVAGGLREVGEGEYEARLATCRACEHFEENRCKVCGCRVGGGVLAKARWAAERCPLGRWPDQDAGASGNVTSS